MILGSIPSPGTMATICGKTERREQYLYICRRKPGHAGPCAMGRRTIQPVKEDSMLRQLDDFANKVGWQKAEKIIMQWMLGHYEK